MQTKQLPIYDNRIIVGHATTEKRAKKILSDKLQSIPKGWKISVRLRNTALIDLPEGWVYSVHP
jgi:hypothetical protein